VKPSSSTLPLTVGRKYVFEFAPALRCFAIRAMPRSDAGDVRIESENDK
jgi:hypothetical protein